MYFEIIGKISDVEVIAEGSGIRELANLKQQFGGKNWKKKKGRATISLEDGGVHEAEIHWYEAHGIGKKKLKIKRLLD